MAIAHVKKNNGREEPFDAEKLYWSVLNALKHVDRDDHDFAKLVTREAISDIEKRGHDPVPTDAIRQTVLHVLKEQGERRGAAAYEMTSLYLTGLPMGNVIKRNGDEEPFHPYKLFRSIKKAFKDAGEGNGKRVELLTKEIATRIAEEYAGKAVAADTIRSYTAHTLQKNGFANVERRYIIQEKAKKTSIVKRDAHHIKK
jgi:transcriptional regulator NrdR family protein